MNPKQEEFNKKERFVLDFFVDYHNELAESISALENNPLKFVKSQLCLAFIAADTFSIFYQLLNESDNNSKPKNNFFKKILKWHWHKKVNRNYKNEKRFKNWFNKFVLTYENQIYRSNVKKFKDCNASILWRIRCSFLHFFSLPDVKYGNFIIGGTPLNNELSVKITEKDRKKLNLRLIYHSELIDAIFLSLENQVEELAKMIRERPNDYIVGIEKCYKILQAEGAKTRNFKNYFKEN